MNRLDIYRNEYDKVVRCEYVEDNDGYIFETINLPGEELDKIFYELMNGKYNNKYSNCDESIHGELIHFSFYDIDVNIIDALIRESKMYRRTTETAHKPTLSRKNKFKKKAVMASSLLLAVLSLYGFLFKIKPNRDTFINNVPAMTEETSYVDVSPMPTSDDTVKLDNETIEFVMRIMDDSSKQTEEKKTVKEESIEDTFVNSEKTYVQVLSLDVIDETNSEKAFITRAYYFETISSIASEYGIDPNLALAICTQERGVHSSSVEIDGGLGLFQIQVEGNWNWNGKQICAYNFKNESYETKTITTESAGDVFENIRIGCMILQEALVQRNYNVAQAVTYYNCGNYIDSNIISCCCMNTGLTASEINSDPDNLEWLNYRNNLKCGDPNYLENVFKYIDNGTTLKFTKPSGEKVSVIYNNTAYSKNIGRA